MKGREGRVEHDKVNVSKSTGTRILNHLSLTKISPKPCSRPLRVGS